MHRGVSFALPSRASLSSFVLRRRCDDATDGGCIVSLFPAPDIVSSVKFKAIPSIDLFLYELMPYEVIEKLQRDLVGAQRAGSSRDGSSSKVLASACFEFERLAVAQCMNDGKVVPPHGRKAAETPKSK